jgi:hypothetical protein
MDLPPLPWAPNASSGAPDLSSSSYTPQPVHNTLAQPLGRSPATATATPHGAHQAIRSDGNSAGRSELDVPPCFPSTPQLPKLGTLSQHIGQVPRRIVTPAQPNSTPETSTPKLEYRNYNFGAAAPSRNLLFPSSANITAVELLTFLPNCVHSASVIYRFCSNGAKPNVINTIINMQRDLEVEWGQNKCRQAMYEAMDKSGYKGWKFKQHDKYHEEKKDSWNEDGLGVGGFLTPGQVRGGETPAPDVPFRSLAVDVRRMPQCDDALDLTRMVHHCVEKPGEPWMYPRDWDALLGVVGGPVAQNKEHTDRESFNRWGRVVAPPPGKGVPNALLEAHKREEERKKVHKMKTGEGDGPRRKHRKKEKAATPRELSATPSTGGTPIGRCHLSREIPASATPSMGGTPIPETQQPKKKRGRPFNTVKIEDDMPEMRQYEEEMTSSSPTYQIQAAYVSPPASAIRPLHEALQPSPAHDALIDTAFSREGQIGENNPYSAYAFGGPRRTPPYRLLNLIEQPDPDDVSGWAENLRWAFEQNTLFRLPHRPDAWNESPEHMEKIVGSRREQGWMSEELMDA